MRDILIAVPAWAIALALFLFFSVVALCARSLGRRRGSPERRTELTDEAVRLLTGLAATFAFFVGFAITVTWGAVSAGQSAVEQHASALKQMSWSINSIQDHAESAMLMEKLRDYAIAVANDDAAYLARADTANLPSAVPLDRFEDALHRYAFGPNAPAAEVSSLVREAASVSGSSAELSAVAQRNLPGKLAILLLVTGVLVAGVMGISTVSARYPWLMLVWCLIPALSITVVIALAFPFAAGVGVDLAPLTAVAQQLVVR
ncbi:hypothetical protein BH09ACT7_BH09ACT7_12580 [soil metagenome]